MVGVDPGRDLRVRGGERERREGQLPLAPEAAHAGAAGDPARVEADEVVAGADLVGEQVLPVEDDLRDTRSARAARVQEQRPDPVLRVAGGQPREGELDLRAARIAVVERHLHERALHRPAEALAPRDLRRRPHGRRRHDQHAERDPDPGEYGAAEHGPLLPVGTGPLPHRTGRVSTPISPGRCAPPRRCGPRSASRPSRGSSRTAAAPRPCRRARPARRDRRSTPWRCARRARR